MLSSPSLRQLRQRVELFIQLGPLNASETAAYIEHRLRLAQPTRAVRFTPDAMQTVHRIAQGVPRDINKICDASLLVAYVEESSTLRTRHVEEAVRTIDAQSVALRLRGVRPHGPWHRLWAGAAAAAACAALVVAADTGSIGPEGTSLASVGAMRLPAPGPGSEERAILIHLASFRERGMAQEFAGRAPVSAPQVLYLQRHGSEEGTWYRVLLGDFRSPQEAQSLANATLRDGTYTYAQPVQVRTAELEAWEAP
jgi:hypothetical protein